jgi:hypothetical protein
LTQLRIPISSDAIGFIQKNDEARAQLIASSQSFAAFLKHWKVRDPASGEVFILGDRIWPGQDRFLWAIQEHDWIYSLKARKLGYTTLAVAYDGWCLRFKNPNGRVHLFSRNEGAAIDLMDRVKFGMSSLPEWMQLPIAHSTQKMMKIEAGPDDLRVCEAYPASEETAVEQSASHAHLDEWWRMRNPAKVWQAVSPSIFGTCHIITTGLGPVGYPASFWKKTIAGETKFYGLFTPATARPDRDELWFQQMRSSMSELQFRHEYPLTWQDALAATTDFLFLPEQLSNAQAGAWGPTQPQEGRKYVKAWDIGRHKDAAVGIVLDITGDGPCQVVAYERLRETPYPVIQEHIERMHYHYSNGLTLIEDNAAGEAVRENLDISPRQVLGFKTTIKSKTKIISNLQMAFQGGTLKYDRRHWPQLHDELSIYMLNDKLLVQDSVMALAIAYSHYTGGGNAPSGKLRKIFAWN